MYPSQGIVFGPLFFIVYINDMSDNLVSDEMLFSDDIFLFRIQQLIVSRIQKNGNQVMVFLFEISFQLLDISFE